MPIKARIGRAQLKKFTERVNEIKNAAFRRQDAEALGKAIIAEMKDGISKGLSPIDGEGRFPAYKRAGEKDGYPNNVRYKYPDKRQRPVNLFLSGKFLNDLKFKIFQGKYGMGVEIGYYSTLSSKKEEGHAIGWNGQPKRPTIPQGKQTFSPRIQRIILTAFKQAISRVVKGK